MNDDWLLMGDVPGRAARLWRDNVALVFEGDRWTHGDFAEDVEKVAKALIAVGVEHCLLYTSPSPRDYAASRMPSSA